MLELEQLYLEKKILLKITTSHLSRKICKTNELQKHQIIDTCNFEMMYKFLSKARKEPLLIYDLTKMIKLNHGTIIHVNDHINKTGKNILIGKQKKLNIDFIDLSSLYVKAVDGRVSTSFGDRLNKGTEAPNHFLCNLSILAKALGFHLIMAKLYNITK